MEQLIPTIPQNYIDLFLVTCFSLVIGLSQRKMHLKNEDTDAFFGSDRTFTLIGILSYILYIIAPESKVFWGVGGFGLLLLLAFNYYFKLYHLKRYGLTSIITACITYCIPALVMTQPVPFTLLVLVLVLLLTEMKETFISLASRMNDDEFTMLTKFIIIAGIVLPLLPNERIVDAINLTPRNIWLATVIISGVSYVSYLVQKFLFKDSGLIVAGILGGLYSSTATTVVLSRKSKTADKAIQHRYVGAVLLSTSMMFVRVMVLVLIFNASLFSHVWGYCMLLFFVTFITGLVVYYHKGFGKETVESRQSINDKNPLEFKVAIIFALLFVALTVVTHYVISMFGTGGLTALSFAVGVTDITPFLTSLYQGEYAINASMIAMATCCATFSNNLVKMGYAFFLGAKSNRRLVVIGYSVACTLNLLLLLFLY
jgi:uncharacterized membrane protein (DUF4010 family)